MYSHTFHKQAPQCPIKILECLRNDYQKKIESVGADSALFDTNVYAKNLGAIQALTEAINIIQLQPALQNTQPESQNTQPESKTNMELK